MEKYRGRTIAALVCACLAVALLAGCGGNAGNGAEGGRPGSDAKPFAGKKITAYMGNIGTTEVIQEHLSEFEAETGMKVEIQSFANDQLSQKLTVQLTAGSAEPDVAMLRVAQEFKLFNQNGWLTPLDEYARDNESFDLDDFTPSVLGATTVDGKVLGIPMVTEQQVLYYRKDLLEQANIPVPKTLDELEQAALKLHDPGNEMYGFVARGTKQGLVPIVSSFIFSEGGDFTDGDTATINTPEAVKGMTRYADLLRNSGPPGVLNMEFAQASAVFSQGKAAFFTDTNAILSTLIDREKSAIVDQIGFAMFPAGSAGSRPFNNTGFAMFMNPATPDKAAAWAFIEWATSRDIMLKAQQKGVPGARDSIWNDPAGSAGFTDEFQAVVQESLKVAVDHFLPNVINVSQSRDIVGEAVVRGIMGENIQAAADKANQELQALLDKERSN